MAQTAEYYRIEKENMITYPIAKINLGLNVVEKRPDGYHNLQTVFYPVPIMDALEVVPMSDGFPSDVAYSASNTRPSVEMHPDASRNGGRQQ